MKTKNLALKRSCLATAVALMCAQQAWAVDFETDGGWKGNWNTALSAGSAWRAQAPDKSLIGASDAAIVKGYAATTGSNALGTNAARADGYLGAANSDVGNLNFSKGQRYSAPFKVISELAMSKGGMGFKVAAKGWYDEVLKEEGVPFGNQQNGFNGATSTFQTAPAANTNLAQLTTLGSARPLSDRNFPAMSKFSGVALMDAYVYNTFNLGEQALKLSAGNQTLRWGNSIFVQGLSQVSPIDATAQRKPGSDPSETLLPVWSIEGKLSLSNGVAVDGFYQVKARSSNVESCGTYWGAADFGLGSVGDFCSMAQVANGTTGGWAGAMSDTRPDLMIVPGHQAKDSGQFGFSSHFPVNAIATEFGLYAASISSRVPYISGLLQPGTGVAPKNSPTSGTRMQALWDYPDAIKLFGLTSSTKLDSWKLGAELSYSPNQPVQINANSLVSVGLGYASNGAAAVTSFGPLGQRVLASGASATSWGYLQGYDRVSKTQLVLNAATPISKAIVGALSASGGQFVAELATQQSNIAAADVSFSATGAATLNSLLYGRAFIFGLPVGSALCAPTGAAGTNSQPQGCKVDGFYTKNAWGFRLRAALNYTNVFGSGWNVTPSAFYSEDVQGYSVDGQFNEGRKTLNVGLTMDLKKRHTVSVGYTRYADGASYDVFRDRDNYTAAYKYQF